MISFIIVCPLVFLAGFVDAIAGGGGLISLPAYLMAGIPVHMAIATNKFSATMGTSVSTWRYAKKGYVQWKLAPVCVLGAMVGAPLGANLALMINDRIFKILMLFILPATAVYILTRKEINSEKPPYSNGKTMLLGGIISFVIGIYDGFYGPGTGTFLLLLLTGIAHMKIQEANGLTKVINLTTNVTSLIVYLINGKVWLLLGVTAGIFGIAGNYAGAVYFEKGGAKSVKPVMMLVIVLFFVKVASDFFA